MHLILCISELCCFISWKTWSDTDRLSMKHRIQNAFDLVVYHKSTSMPSTGGERERAEVTHWTALIYHWDVQFSLLTLACVWNHDLYPTGQGQIIEFSQRNEEVAWGKAKMAKNMYRQRDTGCKEGTQKGADVFDSLNRWTWGYL